MAFSRFIWTILAFIMAIAVTSVAFGIFLRKPGFPFSVSFFVLLLILEATLLLWYLLKIRRDLLRLVLALKHKDTSMQFRKNRSDPYFNAMYKEFNEIIRDFRLVRLDREAEQHFFEATVNHIRFGLLAFNTEGNIELANEALLQLFGLKKHSDMGELNSLDELDEVSAGLPDWIRQLNVGDETLKKLNIQNQDYHLIFLVSRFRVKEQEITLVSVRDISREIDRNELEAWQKLMRVLRHEILNSVTPIRLLSGSLSKIVMDISLSAIDQEDITNLKTGLDTIHRRAKGLSKFLDTYSNLYRVPEPDISPVTARDLLRRASVLQGEQTGNKPVEIESKCENPELKINMDERMIEQVLINLIKNALEALKGVKEPRITLSAFTDKGHPYLSVKDNGPGIPSDQLDHIFIPFYSTREQGSGIGLSFAQHVMRLHNGHIHVRSGSERGSEFLLIFPIPEGRSNN